MTKGIIILANISFMIIQGASGITISRIFFFFNVRLITETNYMNQNIQRGNKPSSLSQTSTSHWVSTSQSHHCSLSKCPLRATEIFNKHTQADDPSVPLLPTPGVRATHPTTEKEHGFPTAIPAPTSISGHKPQTGKILCPLGIRPPFPLEWRGDKFTTYSKRLSKFAWEVVR